jgi:hypothetical protein
MGDLQDHFSARLAALSPLDTTTTASGDTVQWIAPEQRLQEGAELAAAPAAPPQSSPLGPDEVRVSFELDEEGAELGPDGTVPLAGKSPGSLPDVSLNTYLAKPGIYGLPAPGQNLTKGYFRAPGDIESDSYGLSAVLTVWSPMLENSGDHSLAEVWLVRADLPQQQSVEAGWIVSQGQYGDLRPRFFTWYTTTGWQKQDEWLGGYDTNVAGWVQIDRTVYPGAVLVNASQLGGQRVILPVEYRLVDGAWWLAVNERWIGYYPGALFAQGAADGTLGTCATRSLAGGEVYSSRDDPSSTTTQMGSGVYPDDASELGGIAYVRNAAYLATPDAEAVDMKGPIDPDDEALFGVVPYQGKNAGLGAAYLFGGPRAPVAM